MIRYDASIDPCDLDFLFFKLHQLYRILVACDVPDSVLENLSRCFHLLSDLQDQSTQFNDTTGYTPPQVTSGEVGCPKFDISVEQLESLLDTGLSCSSIATSLGVSLRTIRRRMFEYGLSVRALTIHYDQ